MVWAIWHRDHALGYPQKEIQLPIEVQKEDCLSAQTVLESATITAPLVRDLRISGRYEVHNEDVKSEVEAHHDLSWYMEILALDVTEHLLVNLKEKTDAVAASLCVRRPGAATLHRAAQRYAQVQGALRRKARKYPMPAPAQQRLHLHVPVERPIHPPWYLSMVWVMLSPFREETSPLLEQLDLEAHGQGSLDSIVMVWEMPEVAASQESEYVRVSPFSEDHTSMWARLG
jgi:hypothetical protein